MIEITKRFIETYKSMGLNGYKMNKACPVLSKQKISNIENGKHEVSLDMLTAFFETYPDVNREYILIGKGNPVVDAQTKNESNVVKVSPYLQDALVKVQYVPIDAMASFVESLYDTAYEIDSYGVMPEEGEVLDSSYMVFQVRGDSMEPTIPDGAKILARKIEEGLWESASGVVSIVYGKTLSVKRILKNSLFLDNVLTLKADNPKHGQLDVERREIRGMWQALRIISQKII
ncbi:S24 family peptidase [Bacteroides uniformis]|uniref:S24 family peptidase n=1 Tax=Bacteroides uniformis TaxID=820 RepID=A0AAW6GQA9_BACUN|nr:LexA family transcriptional regulator [Bacteroides uniformis]MDC1880843.1 S24 family peptidase [Bacteroides uniformis]MDC1884367.1 S24 family peptidase [Bacteroides uniformis]